MNSPKPRTQHIDAGQNDAASATVSDNQISAVAAEHIAILKRIGAEPELIALMEQVAARIARNAR